VLSIGYEEGGAGASPHTSSTTLIVEGGLIHFLHRREVPGRPSLPQDLREGVAAPRPQAARRWVHTAECAQVECHAPVAAADAGGIELDEAAGVFATGSDNRRHKDQAE
jgi:hypothetical protein